MYFSNTKISLNKNLNDIVENIRDEAKKLVGTGMAQLVADVSTMTYRVKFERKQNKNGCGVVH